MSRLFHLLLLLLLLHLRSSQAQENSTCIPASRTLPQEQNNQVYKIGILAIRGSKAAHDEFNRTFSEYLTTTAGQRFDPPIRFELKPLNFTSLFSDVNDTNVDFLYVNPSFFSCIESEYGANSLVSQITRRVVGGRVYSLTRFGGVIFARSDREDIDSIDDVRDRIVACEGISGLGSGQMQFREVIRNGLSVLQDVKQIVFTSDEGKVVEGVLNGDFDVGFVRTDRIERTRNRDGELVDKSQLKILDAKPNLNIDGEPFPFESSTPLYAEWNVASLTHVPNGVAIEVQSAMLQVADHAVVGEALEKCYGSQNCTGTHSFLSNKQCQDFCWSSLPLELFNRCDTTPSLALLAHDAKTKGKYSGWRSTLSYMELRNMQEETGFIRKDKESGINKCIRSKKIYDAITCPPGHFRKTEEEVLNGCSEVGLVCKEGFQCLCKPCVKAFDVDVFPFNETSGKQQRGCDRFALCGSVEQRKTLHFRAIDNKKRDDLVITATLFEGSTTRDLEATSVANASHTYDLEISTEGSHVGIIIFQIFANGDQIPESPLRLEVAEPDCRAITGDALKMADEFGYCICEDTAIEIGNTCVGHNVLLPSILVPLFVLMLIGVYFYVETKRKQADSVWVVKPDELHFDDPPEIVGRGTFGLVLLAEYRGTKVAVKRVIPPRLQKKKGSISSTDEKDSTLISMLGQGDDPEMPIAELEMKTTYPDENGILEGVPVEDTLNKKENGEMRRQVKWKGSDTSLPTLVERRNSLASSESESASLSGNNSSTTNKEFTDLPSIPPPSALKMESTDSLPPMFTPSVKNTRDVDATVVHKRIQRASPVGPGTVTSNEPSAQTVEPILGAKSGGKMKRTRVGLSSGTMSFGKNSGSFGLVSGLASGSMVSETKKNRLSLKVFRSVDNEYSKLKTEFTSEMRYLSKLRHPCITTVMGAVIDRKHEPMLIMEYMDHGSLYDILHNASMEVEGEILLPILRDIAQGVRFLHAANPQVIHGDLKAQNVLVDSKLRGKVADFGLSQKKKVGATGTPFWMAPELLRGESENTSMSDVYSFGVILYEVYSRKDPYENENPMEVLRLVADDKVNKRPPVPDACPPAIASLMTDSLVSDPAARPVFEELDLRLKRLDVEKVQPGAMYLSMQARKNKIAERNEELLFDVFPKHIAEALRDGRKIEPEHRDCATVYFSDIVGYTTMCSTLEPVKISDMLNRLYSGFDDLATRYGVFKIETVGDAYMAVTNLVTDQTDTHVKAMARFAIDAIQAASDTLVDIDDPSKGTVRIRAGFHAGAIVSNVVGTRLPKYTIFGDTLNVAARMESNSIPLKIQVTDKTAALLKEQWPEAKLTYRGKIHVKGKGEICTYFVNEDVRDMY